MRWLISLASISLVLFQRSALAKSPPHITPLKKCPKQETYGKPPPKKCPKPVDPNNKPPSAVESWFTEEMFNDLFPWANIGWGPHDCFPYSYKNFVIALRYFPDFGTTSPDNGYNKTENTRRDVAAFFAHAVQETGANDPSIYKKMKKKAADDCFYRGGLFNWFEGGPTTTLVRNGGGSPKDGTGCTGTMYCSDNPVHPCNPKACYIGRGVIQISYNYNYGMFMDWLAEQNVHVDLLKNPNLVLTKTDPPLALMASLWFYMTPQPPKPAMHDIVLGQWIGKKPMFGPTSLVINNECGGMDKSVPGGGGENRRIRAFLWFCKYFRVPAGKMNTLTCKGMKKSGDMSGPFKEKAPDHMRSYQPHWTEACKCKPAGYSDPAMPIYYAPGYYPEKFVSRNKDALHRCEMLLYKNWKQMSAPECKTKPSEKDDSKDKCKTKTSGKEGSKRKCKTKTSRKDGSKKKKRVSKKKSRTD